jgi:hypothetical protein
MTNARSFLMSMLSVALLGGCGSSPLHGVSGAGGNGGGGMTGSGMPGVAGMPGMPGKPGMPGGASTGSGDAGVVMCTPGVEQTSVTDCGYPYTSSTPLTSVVFNEVEVLRAIQPAGGVPLAIVRLFYNDEHALTLGVRSVVVKTASGSTTTDYAVSPLTTNPGAVTSAETGTNDLVGDQSGLDQSLRPMWPVLYLTDVTSNPASRSGDWQLGGRPFPPTSVFGTWKAAVRTVDKTVSPAAVTITPDADPAKNNWNLGAGSDTVPSGLMNEGFGAEVLWQVPLASGHSYRLQVMVHDGDQNKAGGDSGEACVVYCTGGSGGEGAGGAGGGPPPPSCPAGYTSCAAQGIEPVECPGGTVCANGCCVPVVP